MAMLLFYDLIYDMTQNRQILHDDCRQDFSWWNTSDTFCPSFSLPATVKGTVSEAFLPFNLTVDMIRKNGITIFARSLSNADPWFIL
jgi:hypothetical protein